TEQAAGALQARPLHAHEEHLPHQPGFGGAPGFVAAALALAVFSQIPARPLSSATRAIGGWLQIQRRPDSSREFARLSRPTAPPDACLSLRATARLEAASGSHASLAPRTGVGGPRFSARRTRAGNVPGNSESARQRCPHFAAHA